MKGYVRRGGSVKQIEAGRTAANTAKLKKKRFMEMVDNKEQRLLHVRRL
jgi:hypothetical protein